MEIVIAIVLFIIASICAACKGDTSGIEVIFSILLVVFVFWLIYKAGIGGAVFVIGIILLLVFAITFANNKGGK